MSDHYLTVTISPGDLPEIYIDCRAAKDAPCRQVPDCLVCEGEGCSECPKYATKIVDFCNPLSWIHGSEGPHYTFGGNPNTPLRSGPVFFKWDGEFYVWDYAEADR